MQTAVSHPASASVLLWKGAWCGEKPVWAPWLLQLPERAAGMAYTGGSALMPWVGERLELQVATSTFPSAEVKVRWDLHRWPVINSCAFDGLLWKEATYSHSSLGSFGWANPSVGHVQGSNWFMESGCHRWVVTNQGCGGTRHWNKKTSEILITKASCCPGHTIFTVQPRSQHWF